MGEFYLAIVFDSAEETIEHKKFSTFESANQWCEENTFYASVITATICHVLPDGSVKAFSYDEWCDVEEVSA